MTGMIGKVARALCAENGEDPDELRIYTNAAGDEAALESWLAYVSEARAAIEAMRPATQAMLQAGWPYYSAMSNEPNGILDGAQKRHDAYIDAALSETEGG